MRMCNWSAIDKVYFVRYILSGIFCPGIFCPGIFCPDIFCPGIFCPATGRFTFPMTQLSRDFSISNETARKFSFTKLFDERLSSNWIDFVFGFPYYIVYED